MSVIDYKLVGIVLGAMGGDAMTNEPNNQAADTPHCWSCKKEISPTDSFCSHCGAKVGGGRGTLWKKLILGGALLFLGGWILLRLFGSEGGISDLVNVSTPDIRVEKSRSPGGEQMTVTNIGQPPITIQSGSLNGKEIYKKWSDMGEGDCGAFALNGTSLPQTLEMGQSAKFYIYSICGEIIEATIHTDHGSAKYTWK